MSSDSSSSSSTNTNTTTNLRDPLGLLNLDEFGRPKFANGQGGGGGGGGGDSPTAVKIIGTARDDLNGLLGFCTSYNTERERYMIRMANVDTANANATVMALKPSNLQKASIIEKYKAQIQQLLTDPAVRQKVAYYYNTINNKLPYKFKLEYVIGTCIMIFIALFYLMGFTKTLMLCSATLMIGLILQEDIKQKSNLRQVITNFPSRCKIVLEKQFPFLKGRGILNDNIALGIVGLLLILTIQSIFFTTSSSSSVGGGVGGGGGGSGNSSTIMPHSSRPAPMPTKLSAASSLSNQREQMEKYYYMGFKDSIDGNERGHSLSKELQRLLEEEASKSSEQEHEEEDLIRDIPYSSSSSQLPNMASSQSLPKTFLSKLLSFRTVGSLFYFYRIATSLGIDPLTNIFSLGQLMANIQHNMPNWQKGMMAFSFYNLISNLFF
jgi:hypothetical protein